RPIAIQYRLVERLLVEGTARHLQIGFVMRASQQIGEDAPQTIMGTALLAVDRGINQSVGAYGPPLRSPVNTFKRPFDKFDGCACADEDTIGACTGKFEHLRPRGR